MRERPILFSAPMVRSLLGVTKTQTRRVVRPTPPLGAAFPAPISNGPPGTFGLHVDGAASLHRIRCPYGAPGDRLVVRETWQYAGWTEDGYPHIGYRADDARVLVERGIPEAWSERLQDIWASLSAPENFAIDHRAADRKWRPAIHMPHWASRIQLEVTEVRVQRLQDITHGDIEAEGIPCEGAPAPSLMQKAVHCSKWIELWNGINGAGSWHANPWVWAVSFRRLKP